MWNTPGTHPRESADTAWHVRARLLALSGRLVRVGQSTFKIGWRPLEGSFAGQDLSYTLHACNLSYMRAARIYRLPRELIDSRLTWVTRYAIAELYAIWQAAIDRFSPLLGKHLQLHVVKSSQPS